MKITAEQLFKIMRQAAAKVCEDDEDIDELLDWEDVSERDRQAFTIAAELIEAM